MPSEHAKLSPSASETSQAVHSRLYRSLGPAKNHHCISCGESALDWAYQYTATPEREFISTGGDRFSVDMDDYAPMCRKCHIRFDRQKDPELFERVRDQMKNVDPSIRSRGGVAYAERLRGDPGLQEAHETFREAGTAAWNERYGSDPEFRSAVQERLKKGREKKSRCVECGRESTNAGIAHHQKATNHEGREGL